VNAGASWARWFGGLLVTASSAFIGYLLWQQWAGLTATALGGRELLALSAAALLYAAACVPLAAAWRHLLNAFSTHRLSRATAQRIFARSQLAKYLPGNIMHLAGRHVLARAAGVSHAALVTALLLEVAGLVSAAGALSLPGVLLYGGLALQQWRPLYLAVLATLLIGAALAAPWLYRALTCRFGLTAPPITGAALRAALAAAWLRYLVFFLLAGLSLCLLALPLLPDLTWASLPLLIFVFCFSWAVGFLTPGAPSGIGVREAVMVLLLSDISTVAGATLIALLFRAVTVLGDLAFFAIDALLARFANRSRLPLAED
jgi:uncharacterized membrane protein YbhN (UPF0104 family)